MTTETIPLSVMFVVLVGGFLLQWLREVRRIHGERVDRAALAAKVESEARQVAAKVEESTEAQTETAAKHAEQILHAIEKNTEVSTRAFHEANTVNLKLEKLGLKQQDIERAAAERQQKP